jgi:WD40 repeat protein
MEQTTIVMQLLAFARSDRLNFSLAMIVLLLAFVTFGGTEVVALGSPPPTLPSPTAIAREIAKIQLSDDVEVTGMDFSADGQYVAATSKWVMANHGTTPGVMVWEWRNAKLIQDLALSPSSRGWPASEAVRFSSDGRFLVTCHGPAAPNHFVARVWDARSWALVQKFEESQKSNGCYATDFTPDGKYLIEVQDRQQDNPANTVTVIQTDNWKPVWGLRTGGFHPHALAISPDGKYAAVGGIGEDPGTFNSGTAGGKSMQAFPSTKNYVAIIDLNKHAIIRSMEAQTAANGRLAWSPDGKSIAVTGSRVVVLDSQSGKELAFEVLDSINMFVRYSPNGKYILESDSRPNGRSDGHGLGIRIWDGEHKNLLQEIPGNITSLAVSRDGKFFAAGSRKMISVWQFVQIAGHDK